ncbi:MAG: hypothetical protein ABIQ31_25250 [Ferruginibacter sp.]
MEYKQFKNMPTPAFLKATFYPEAYYHIVCKSIDSLLLFHDTIDYKIFNERLKKFAGDFVEIWSFCLIPYHSHHVIRIKSTASIIQFIRMLTPANMTPAMKDFYEKNDDELLFNKMINDR